jgi:hypothetical protein
MEQLGEQLLEELETAPAPAHRGAVPPKKMNYTHEACVDLIIARPGISQGQIAAYFGYSQSWLSTVMATDMFKARLAARREELVDPALHATLEERFKGVLEQSLLRLSEKLSQPTPPDNLVLKAVELGAKAFGLGGTAVVVAPPAAASADSLTHLADRLLALQRQTRRISHDVQDVDFAETVQPSRPEASSIELRD